MKTSVIPTVNKVLFNKMQCEFSNDQLAIPKENKFIFPPVAIQMKFIHSFEENVPV